MLFALLACTRPDHTIPDTGPPDSIADSVDSASDSPVDTSPPPAFPAQLADADVIFYGESKDDAGFNPPDWFGWRVTGVGDVDGDDLPDMLMTGRFDDEGGPDAGKVYLVTAADMQAPSMNIADVRYKWYGEGEDDHAGRDLAEAGDIDGDGLGDLFVSAYRNEDEEASGAAYLIYSSSFEEGSHPLEDVDVVIRGQAAHEYLGRAIDGGKDVTGDGHPDLLIGAMGWNNGTGRVCQIDGNAPSSGTLDSTAAACVSGEAQTDNLGMDVSQVGDVDGDGISDVLMGAWTADGDGVVPGAAYLELGGLHGGSADDVAYVWYGPRDWMSLGRSVNGAGDVDGDGLDDILIGAHGSYGTEDSKGHTYLYLASDLGEPGVHDPENATVVFDGMVLDDYSGDALDSAGDVDGDGLDDIVLGALFTGDEGGTAYLWYANQLESGTYDLDDAHHLFHSETDLDRAGAAVAGPGDVDGDGYDDLLVSAYGHDGMRGAVYLILSPY
ncbi:MAG: hypothetical protein GY913_20650 [Proteobacteria bacterium]|nr:hypothetical protein [Pseudomonadota bacterium]MCP4919318.1 hypothetical protein [Pseudomonadota bacterium]